MEGTRRVKGLVRRYVGRREREGDGGNKRRVTEKRCKQKQERERRGKVED